MRSLVALLASISTVATADDTPLKNVVLTENLEHPPLLFQCMKRIFPFPVKRFVGPILSDDRLRADYAAIAADGARYLWRFRPAIGATWKAFLYDGPGGVSAVGVSTAAMLPMAEIVPPDRWRMPVAVDVRPCADHFRASSPSR